MNIFILEDDLFQRKKMETIIQDVSTKKGITINRLVSTVKPTELVNSIEGQGNHQLYFLDIDIKQAEKKGLEVAKEIREKDSLGTIVFVTTHSEFAPLTYAYKVSALDFISKEALDLEQRVEECINHVYLRKDQRETEPPFVFENKYRKVKLPFSDLLYFETSDQPHKIVLISKKSRMEFYAKLSDVESLDRRLFRCHKSFVVHLANIVEVDKTNLVLYFFNGESCLVSRRKLKFITEWLKNEKPSDKH